MRYSRMPRTSPGVKAEYCFWCFSGAGCAAAAALLACAWAMRSPRVKVPLAPPGSASLQPWCLSFRCWARVMWSRSPLPHARQCTLPTQVTLQNRQVVVYCWASDVVSQPHAKPLGQCTLPTQAALHPLCSPLPNGVSIGFTAHALLQP